MLHFTHDVDALKTILVQGQTSVIGRRFNLLGHLAIPVHIILVHSLGAHDIVFAPCRIGGQNALPHANRYLPGKDTPAVAR